jgi:soluble lytic murein transglycosylase-like protein
MAAFYKRRILPLIGITLFSIGGALRSLNLISWRFYRGSIRLLSLAILCMSIPVVMFQDGRSLATPYVTHLAAPQPGDFKTPSVSVATKLYAAHFKAAGSHYAVSDYFLMAQVNAESLGNSRAVNHLTATGHPSVGLAQFQLKTAKQYRINPRNPVSAINGQAAYMSDLLKKFGGDYSKAAAAYNWGPKHVLRIIVQYGDAWQEHTPDATQRYLKNIYGALGVVTSIPPAPQG